MTNGGMTEQMQTAKTNEKQKKQLLFDSGKAQEAQTVDGAKMFALMQEKTDANMRIGELEQALEESEQALTLKTRECEMLQKQIDAQAEKGVKLPPMTSADVENALAALGITVRQDVITGQYDIHGLPEVYSKGNATNILPVFVMDFIKSKRMRCTMEYLKDCIMLIAERNRFNPFLEMLNNNPWDGVNRLEELPSILGIDPNGTEFRVYVLKWLHQTIAMALNDENEPYGADGVLVLKGEQGIGKTRFFELLAIKSEWFSEGVRLDLNDKDSVIQATSTVITELGELESTTRKKQESLRAFLTSQKDKYRLPYARTYADMERRTSFCGTVNPEKFLYDETGSRRFWVVHVDSIDHKRLAKLGTAWTVQLWAQVYEQYYKPNPQGFRLTASERAALEESNEQHAEAMKGETEIRDSFDWEQDKHEWQWYTATDVKRMLALNNLDAGKIGKALKKIATQNKSEPKHSNGAVWYLLPTKIR